jgi:serine/threonine protein kinase
MKDPLVRCSDTTVNACPEISSDKQTSERFKQEVRLAKEVTHDNVCRVFDLDNHNVPPFITMELLDGETLSAHPRIFRF